MYFASSIVGRKVEGRYQRQQMWPLASGLIDIKESMVEILGTRSESLPCLSLDVLCNGVRHIHL